MDPETIKALIQKNKLEIEFLQQMNRRLEDQLPSSGSQEITNRISDSDNNVTKSKDRPVGDPISGVREWQFFNKSQPDAAEQLLEMVGHPLAIAALVDGLEKGNLKIGGETAAEKRQNLATVLARSGRFGRAARGTWGLPNWPNIKAVKPKSGKDSGDDAVELEDSENSQKATATESKPS